jgi:2-polyprenyl-3-methyl-5-hydroxy-6-metoxy-1,4-benzoquinol methylase
MNQANPVTYTDPSGSQTLEVISKANSFNKWMYNAIKHYLDGNILEIGSGLGNISRYAIEDKKTITLSDINPAYRATLKKQFGTFPAVKDVLSIDLQHKDFFNHYATLKEQYDTVFLLNVIEHLEDDRSAIENCRFLLKPRGRLVLLTPAYRWLYCRFDRELGHYRRYTRKNLRQVVLSSSFKINRSWYFNLAGIAGWLFFGKILGKKLIGQREMNTYDKLVPVFKLADRLTFNKAGLSVIMIAEKN